MNKTILKLAEQATIQSVSENFIGSYSVSGSRCRGRNRAGEKLEITTPPKEWAAKFAELIVQECIDVMKQNDYHGEWLGERIKEHFGIKE